MPARSGALALKAATVAAVFAMLVAPSLGRCRGSPSQAPPPPPPPPPPPSPAPLPPTPAPAPGPMISCNDCYSQCYTPCNASIPSKCSSSCDHIEGSCNSCKTKAIEECRAKKNCTGSCGECNDAPNFSCANACTTRNCNACLLGTPLVCQRTCSTECSEPKCIP